MTLPCVCGVSYETHLLQRWHVCHQCGHAWDLTPKPMDPASGPLSQDQQLLLSENEDREETA